MLTKDFIIAGTITLLLDIGLVFLLFQTKLVNFDKAFIISALVLHALFYYALLYDIHYLIDLLHMSIFLFMNVAIFIKNELLLGLNLLLITVIQILWMVEERCILNREPNQFGYGKWIGTYIILLSIILSMKFGCVLFSPRK